MFCAFMLQAQGLPLDAREWMLPYHSTLLCTDAHCGNPAHLQVGSDDWDRKEKALVALRSLPQRHGAAGTAALVEAGAESTLREVRGSSECCEGQG